MYALSRALDVSARSFHCFKTFIIGGEAVSRINAPTEDRVGQLFNGIVITRSLGRHYLALSRSLDFSLPPSLSPSVCLSLFPPSLSPHCRSPPSHARFLFLSSLCVLPFRSSPFSVHCSLSRLSDGRRVAFSHSPVFLPRRPRLYYVAFSSFVTVAFSLLSSFNSLILH